MGLNCPVTQCILEAAGTELSVARLPESKKQGVELEYVYCILAPSDPSAEFLLPDPTSLGSAGLEDQI